jgi:hypothetical protein
MEYSGPVAVDELGELSSDVLREVEGRISYLGSAMVALSTLSLPTSLDPLLPHDYIIPDKILFPVHHSHHMLTTPALPLIRTQRK